MRGFIDPPTPFQTRPSPSNPLKRQLQVEKQRISDDIYNYYHIHDKKLGEGGFAKVRLATHLATRQNVAIKCLDKIKLGSELPRIYNEIECLKRLKHQNIARLYQVFETSTVIYLVLEYCAGGELFDYIVSKSKLEETESAQIIYDLMRVLDFIHINGFAHRDLKPENVLFDDKHQIKLIDFGLAANCSADNLASNRNQPAMDQLSTCCGSVTYAAPEVISGAIYSGTAVDVWSAGVMLYALLVGQLPFNDNSIPKLYQKIQNGVKTLPSFLSAEASDLIRRMLIVDPKQRITVREVLQHAWLRIRTSTFARINRRLDFSSGQVDEHMLSRCHDKFPNLSLAKLREYIEADFNYFSTTYHLMLAKCPPRALAVKRTPDRQQLTVLQSPYVSPTKRTRFVTVSTTPKTPKTPPSYLKHLHQAEHNVSQNGSENCALNTTPTKRANISSATNTNQQENTNRMAAFAYNPTPKKSIVKRLLESATPSKLKQPRKMLFQQNTIMNVTLTRFKDPEICLDHFRKELESKGFQCKRKDFSLKCYNQSIRLTLEVCVYNNQCAIQRKRIQGDAWQYKLICEEILRISNTGINDGKRTPVKESKTIACTDL